MNMIQLCYDGGFNGFLTSVFETYNRKLKNVSIVKIKYIKTPSTPGNLVITSDSDKAKRVWEGLKSKLSADGLKIIYWCFLSDINGIENTILRFIQLAFSAEKNIEKDYGNTDVLELSKLAEKVGREKLRLSSMLRFTNIGRDVFYAPVESVYNVLPLVAPHFKKAYPDEHWVMFDTKRKYGIYYDRNEKTLSEAAIDFAPEHKEEVIARFEPDEVKYQVLWQNHFKNSSTAIRKNAALHLTRVLPGYWKYLPVKKQNT